MTPSEINAAIAEWMGWEDISPTFHVGINPKTGQPRPVPNYHGDLNACWDFEHQLNLDQSHSYEKWLDKIVNLNFETGDSCLINAVWHASAPERCEALLRMLNLWKE